MPALVDLLDQFFFSDVPGAQARDALVHAWELASGMTWELLYAQSLDDALNEELPHLSAFAGSGTPRPTLPELTNLVRQDLGEAGNHVLALERNSATFLTELARAMQSNRLIVIRQHNLFTDEYRQILLNFFDHAHFRFKGIVTDHEPEFSAALSSAAGYDSIVIASISNFLDRTFNVTLPSLPASAHAPAEKVDAPETISRPVMHLTDNLAPEADSIPMKAESAESVETPSISAQDSPPASVVPDLNEPRATPNRLRVLLATPVDVLAERALLIHLIGELDIQARARFGLELALVNPTASEIASVSSAAELADIFIGAVWLQFGASLVESDAKTQEPFFAGTEQDFEIALEQGSERNAGWLRTVVYRSIRPPQDLLHLNVAEYTRVQQFFERASTYGGEDLVRVYNDANELLADARARLEAWIYNYAGDLANALSEYGKTAAANGQSTDALADFDQAIALYRELDHPELEMALWFQVGILQRRIQNRELASHAFDAALRLANRLEEDETAANALHQIGLLSADAGNWREAQRSYHQARMRLKPDAAEYRAIVADEINALTQLGETERAAGQLNRASDAYRDALALAQGIDDYSHIVPLYGKLGSTAEQDGAHQAAVDAFGNGIALIDASTSDETRYALYDGQANSYAQIAAQARDAGDSEAATKAFAAALDANTHGSQIQPRNVEWHSALGALAAQREDWQAAISAYESAIAEMGVGEDTALRRALLASQANAYQQLGDTQFGKQALNAAADAFRQALVVYQALDAREEQGDVLTQLGAVSAAQSRWQEAIDYFNQAIPRLDAQSSLALRQRAQRAQAIAQSHIGDAHRDAKEWGQAEIAYMQARGNLEQLGSSSETGELLVNLGIVTAAQARWQEALAFFQQARARLTAPEQAEIYKHGLRAETDTLRQVGDLRLAAGDTSQAEATYRQQLDLAQQLDDSGLQAEAYQHLGHVAAEVGRWDDAVDLYDQSLAHLGTEPLDSRNSVQRDQLEAYEKIGERERAVQHFPQTEMAYRSALTLAQGLNEREREAELLNILGLVSIEQENWEEALVNLRRALGIYNLMPNAPEKSKVIWNIGRAQRGQKRALLTAALERVQAAREGGNLVQAGPDLESGLQLARELGDAHTEGLVLAEQGDAASEKSDWDGALSAYEQALPKLTEATDEERRATIQRAQLYALRQRSANLREAHHWAQADADLSVALGLARALNDSQMQGELVYESGLVAAGQGRWNDAIDLYSAALDTLDETSDQRPIVEGAQAEAYRELGDSEYDGQNWQGAEASYRQALTLQQSRGDLPAQASLLAALGEVAMRQGEWRSAVDWLTQARPLTAESAPEHLAALDSDLERASIALKREQQGEAETRGDAQRAARDFANAADSYKQALELAEELQDHPARAELNAKLGFVATERGDLDNALVFYRAAASGYDAADNATQRATLMELQAQTLQDMGNRAGENGQWDDALTRYTESIALLDAPTQSDQRNHSVELSAITLQNIGDKARTDSEWGKALDAYRRAAGMFGIVGAGDAQRIVWSREADMLTNLARQARSQNAHAEALQLYLKASDQFIAAQNFTALESLQGEQVSAYREAGDAAFQDKNWSEAGTAYQSGYALAEQIDDRAAQGNLLYQLGQIQTQQAQWQAALEYYRAAHALAEETDQTELRSKITAAQQQAYHALGDTLRAQGSLPAAEENYNGALTAALEQEDHANAGELYFILGMLAADSNAWDKALGNYALALEQMGASDASHRDDILSYQAFAFQQTGDLQRGAGQYDAAASAYASALEIADELGDEERAGEVLYRQGLVAAAHGDWPAALELYQVAEKRLPEASTTRAALGNDTAFAERALNRLQLDAQLQHAELARQELQWDDAATAYRAGLGLTQKLDDTSTQSQIEYALVTLYADKANAIRTEQMWDEADEAFRESMTLAREFHLDDQASSRQVDLIALHALETETLVAEKKWTEARDAAQTQLDVASEFGHRDGQADALYQLGNIAAAQGELAPALDYYKQASPLLADAERSDALVRLGAQVEIVTDHLHRQERQRELLGQAQAAQAQNKYADATTAYRQALGIARELDDTSAQAQIGAGLVKLGAEHVGALQQANDLEGAERAAHAAAVVAQEFNDPAAHADAIYQLGHIAAQQRQWYAAQDYFTQARALLVGQDRAEALQSLDVELDAANDILERQARQVSLVEAGQRAFTAQQLQEASSELESSLQVADSLGQDANAALKADALYELGRVAFAQEQWATAQNYFEQARPLLVEQNRSGALAALDDDLGATKNRIARMAQLSTVLADAQSAVEKADYDDATASFRTGYELARGLGDQEAAANARAGLLETASAKMKSLQQRGDWTNAQHAAEDTLTVALEFNALDTQADAQYHLGEIFAAQAQWRAAQDYYSQAATDYQTLENSSQAALALYEANKAGIILDRQARLAAALSAAQTARDAKNWDDAQSAYRTGYGLANELADETTAANLRTAMQGLADAKTKQLLGSGDWANAERAANDQLALGQEFQEPGAQAEAWNNLGAIAAAQRQWQTALAHYANASELFTSLDNSTRAAEIETASAIATLEWQADQYSVAHSEGDLALGNSRWEEAQTAYTTALELAHTLNDSNRVQEAEQGLRNITIAQFDAARAQGDLALGNSRWEEAQTAYTTALELAHTLNDSNRVQEAEQGLRNITIAQIDAAHAQGDLALGDKKWQEAQDAYAHALELAHTLNDSERVEKAEQAQRNVTVAQIDAAHTQGNLALSNSQWQAATDSYSQALELAQTLNDSQRVEGAEQALRNVTIAQIDAAHAQGDLALENGRWQEAQVAYTQALEFANALNEPRRIGEAHVALGNVAGAQKQWDAATEHLDAALIQFESLKDATLTGSVQTKLVQAASAAGDAHATSQEWQRASQSYTLGLERGGTGATPAERTHILQALGESAAAQNDLSGASRYYDRALAEGTERAPILEKQAGVWHQMGNEAMDAHQYATALDAYQHALELYTELQEPTLRAEVLHSIGLVQAAQGNTTVALEAHQQAYALVQDMDVPAAHVEMLRSIADTQRELGQNDEARANYQRALTDADNAAAGEIEFLLAQMAAQENHWQDALTHLNTAQAHFGVTGDATHSQAIQSAQADSYANLGAVLFGEGQWGDAEKTLTRAMELDTATGRTDRNGILHAQIGLAHAAQEKYVDAAAHYDQALAQLPDEEVGLRDRVLAHLAHSLQQQGKLAQDAGDLAGAEVAYTRAIKMSEASDNFDQVADLWLRLGNVYAAQGRDDDSLGAYRRAYDFDRRDGNALQEHEISAALGRVLLRQGQGALTRGDLTQAETKLEEGLTFASHAENPQLLGLTLQALGDAANSKGDSDDAIEFYARAGRTFAAIEDTDRWRIVSQQQANLLRDSAAHRLETNQFADAENLYRRAWLLQQAAGNTADEAETHFGLGRALLAQERFEDALDELEQADRTFAQDAPQRSELNPLHAEALEALGAKALSESRWVDAQDALTRAANYRDELKNQSRAGMDWQQLAEIARQQNDLPEAVHANEEALARLESPEMADSRRAVLQHQAQILSAIGDQQQQAGDWANASDTYRRALAIAQEQGDLATLAHLYTLLGSLGAAQEHWAEAQAEFEQALDIYQELDQPVSQADTWVQLGDLQRQATHYEDAAKSFEAARDLYHKTGNRLQEGAMFQRLGHVQGDREEWDRALDEYQNALHLYIDMGARREKPEVYRALERAVRNAKLKSADQAAAQGDEYLTAGKWTEAEEAYRDALALYEEADEQVLRAQMQNQMGVALEEQMRPDEALEQYSLALAGFERLGIPEAQVGVLANIGDVQRGRKYWNKAEAAYREALALNQDNNAPARDGELHSSLGMIREAQGDWEEASSHYQQAAAMFESAGLYDAQSDALESLARAQRGARHNTETELKRELESAQSDNNLADAGEILNSLGLMAAEDRRYDEALEYYRQAVATFEKLEVEADMDPVWRTAQGTVLNNIGDASQQIGAWSDADYAYSRALTLAREIGDRESEAILLRNLAIAAQEQEQLPRALDLHFQALQSYRQLGDETPRTELLERVGNLQMALEQKGAAETTFSEALDDARATNDTERIPRLLLQLGTLAEERGASDEALEYYNEALEHAQAPDRLDEQKTLWMRQGALYARASQWEEAEHAQKSALELATQQGDVPLQAELHKQLGHAAASRGDWSTARKHDQEALALYESLNTPREQLLLHERIGHAYAATGDATAADNSYRAALELAPRVQDANTRSLWEARAALAERHNRWNEAAAHYDNARAELAPDAPPEERIELLFRRGDAAMHAADWYAADVSYNDALELANVADNRVQYGLGLNRLGLLARAQRQTDDALEYFQEAIEILRQNNQPLAEAHVLNNIARLKLEANNPAEAELYGQAALAIAQALGSGPEASNSLYLRGLLSMDTQEFSIARRFLNQAIAANPANWAAQLQLGNALLCDGYLTEAVQQAEAGKGQSPDWELGAQTQITIASLYQENTRNFKDNLKRTRAMLSAGAAQTGVAPEVLAAVEWVVRAMEGDAEAVLAELNAASLQPARTVALDAQRFAKTALLALSKSPRRFKGKPALVTSFAMPKPRARKGGRSRRNAPGEENRDGTDE